jgi:hypothetical protein
MYFLTLQPSLTCQGAVALRNTTRAAGTIEPDQVIADWRTKGGDTIRGEFQDALAASK